MTHLAINLRVLGNHLTGVQRYAQELSSRWGQDVERLAPAQSLQGWKAHVWEQALLPRRCAQRFLFSPGNTGPLVCSRQVVTIHDAATFDFAEAFTGLFSRWYRWLLPRLAQRAAGIITVSQFSRDRLVEHLGVEAEKIAVIYNGVTAPAKKLTLGEIDGKLARWNLPSRFLLFVGSHDPRKNLAGLIEGFTQARIEGLALVIAGGTNPRLFAGSDSPATAANVRVLGRVDDEELEALYQRAEAFVFPSFYEGFGLPPLEAMARGCPVICSSATCLPEVCGAPFEQGGACLYFDPERPADIARALQRFTELSRDARQRMIEAGRRRTDRYSWDQCAVETMDFLRECEARCGQAMTESIGPLPGKTEAAMPPVDL